MSRLAVLFRNAHAIAKAGRPFSDMEWMCALDEKKGLDVGALYRTDKKCCESILQKSSGQAVKGVVSVHFLAYVNITRGTADHILNAIVLALEKGLQMTKQTIFTKLVGCGSDGASVMTGCKSGVSTRLKGEQPLLFTLHCMAHRLELGFKGIIGANSFMSTFTELLFAIYNFYHSSALNRENLKSSCAAAALKDESSFMGVPLSGKYDAVQLKADMKCLVDGLTAQLEVRLGENGSDEITSAMHFLSLHSWPHQTEDATFGNQDVALLQRHFGPILENCGVDASVAQTEWDLLKDVVYSLKAKVPPKEPQWVDVFKKAQDSCPNVLQLVDLLLSLPASSADCERGFSLTKVIKSVWRSRLRDTMVTDLMTIQQHSPEIADFDPTPSILRWKGSCKRRLSLCSKSSSE
ncbi:hypothetical protein EMCRGX_G013158 [Ephydatia muelleri]